MKETDWAYLAGLFDGEGTFFLKWSYYPKTKLVYFHPTCHITLANSETFLLEELKSHFGGWVNPFKCRSKSKAHQWTYTWSRWTPPKTKESMENLLRGILPYLKIKKNHVQKLLEIIEIMKHHSPPRAYTREEILRVATISDEIHGFANFHPRNLKWTRDYVEKIIDETKQGSEERIREQDMQRQENVIRFFNRKVL